MDVQSAVAGLVSEAEQQVEDAVWDLTPADRALARGAAAGLEEAVGVPPAADPPPDIERLAHLREALAALAIALARTHGRLAWFLAACIEALTPVLHWRTLPPGDGPDFDTVQPAREQLADAEDAVRRLAAVLARIGA
ncbi:hypothetical protein ACYTFC_00540 [Streptomyces globosus]|uniref:hypothetical protein n=1 Tax=Streptomyces sp. WAC05292 TaxID=2487418 RepID=UPI000F739521|nr:hypothetical protein [Streptomyces sp. WAC05292]RSS94220.1 hypothetical protein EF903_07035 [Streptomyces sp. WAC05292]